jgi:hypothetical protein
MNENGGGYQNIGNGDVFQLAFWSRPGHLYPEVWVFNFYGCIRFVVSIRANLPDRNRIIIPSIDYQARNSVPFFISGS